MNNTLSKDGICIQPHWLVATLMYLLPTSEIVFVVDVC